MSTTEKVEFTQDQGCANDGFVEFCLPDGDEVAFANVQAVAPTAECFPHLEISGRAGCDPAVEYLCMLPIDPDWCVSTFGAMTDDGWRRICDLAGVPAVAQIVPTFFE